MADENAFLEYNSDISAADARQGKDIQGIPWDRLNITRERYRLTRIETYKNYENVLQSGDVVNKEWTSKEKEVINFAGNVAPYEEHNGNFVEGFSQTQVCTMAVKDKLMVFGGFGGELICKHLDKPGVSFCTRTTDDNNAITNAIEIYDSLSGGYRCMASNNDGGIREYEMETYQLLNHFRFPWPVNHTSISPDRKLIAVAGDHVDGFLVDSQSGKEVASVVGHRDYSFATAWHPNGTVFATGNQDKTCRVWDVRKLSEPVSVLLSNMGAVRSIHFSSDGQFLVVAEPADFVHIYNTKVNYEKRQEIDFFGEITGVSLSPDDESLYIGIYDRTFASLLQYNRISEEVAGF